MHKKEIYLDYCSTTPVDKRILEEVIPYMENDYANPSSSHRFGLRIKDKINVAREQVATLIGSNSNEVVFTSGATEAINFAIKGIAEKYSYKGKHIITVKTEHHAVLNTCKSLENHGFEITYLSVDNEGVIDLDELESVIRNDTILVSVMYANNETGVLQPIKELARLAHKSGAIFMSDCTQVVGKLPINVADFEIDLMAFSGHKMYAPKGAGALYISQRFAKERIPSLIDGGGQEFGFRAGTLNVPSIIGLGKACEICKEEMELDSNRIVKLRDKIENRLLSINGSFVNGSRLNRLYNITNICFPGVESGVVIGRLDNISISNGSACNSSVYEPSHVLLSMGLNNDDAFSSLRLSLGRFSDIKEIEIAEQKIVEIINSIKKYA